MDHDLTTLLPTGPAAPRPATPQADTAPAPVVRLASPGSVVATIPYLFGFHPENSLIVLGIGQDVGQDVGQSVGAAEEAGSRPRGRTIRHGIRLDLDQIRGNERASAQDLAFRLREKGAEHAVLIAYGPHGAAGAAARPDHCRKLMAALRAQIESGPLDERVTVVDALYTCSGRWWSYMCRNNRCCPSAGTVVPAGPPQPIESVFTGRGHTIFPSREAMDASLAPYPPPILERTAAAAAALDPSHYDTDAGLTQARRLMDALLARSSADPEDVADAASPGSGDSRAARRPGPNATSSVAVDSDFGSSADSGPNAASSAAVDSSLGFSADSGRSAGSAGSRAARASSPAAADSGAQSPVRHSSSATPLAPPADTDSDSASNTDSRTNTDSGTDSGTGTGTADAPPRANRRTRVNLMDVIPAARTARRVDARLSSPAAPPDNAPAAAPAPAPTITDTETAELLVALLNWRVRDYLACAAATEDSAARLLRLCTELARRAHVPELRLAPYSLTAWAAWAIGRTSLAQCAVDRALAIDPDYKFATLIRAGLHHAIDGAGVRESAANTRRDLFGDTPDPTQASVPPPRSTEHDNQPHQEVP